MIINIAAAGPPQMMEMALFGRPSAELNAYIQHRNQEVDQRLQNMYGDAGRQFLQQSQQYYQTFSQSTGMKAAESMILSSASALDGNMSMNLLPLETYEQLQTAHHRYQNYLMANPVVRQLYLDGRVEGYSDTYQNIEGSAIGWDHHVYREVVSGMSRSSYDPSFDPFDETQAECWVTTTQDSLDGEEPPRFLEKVNVINAWNLQNAAVAENIDPCSIDNFPIRPK